MHYLSYVITICNYNMQLFEVDTHITIVVSGIMGLIKMPCDSGQTLFPNSKINYPLLLLGKLTISEYLYY